MNKQCRSNEFLMGRGRWFVTISYEYNKSRKMYYLCLFLTKGPLYCLFVFFFFLKITKIKAFKKEIQNNKRVWSDSL